MMGAGMTCRQVQDIYRRVYQCSYCFMAAGTGTSHVCLVLRTDESLLRSKG